MSNTKQTSPQQSELFPSFEDWLEKSWLALPPRYSDNVSRERQTDKRQHKRASPSNIPKNYKRPANSPHVMQCPSCCSSPDPATGASANGRCQITQLANQLSKLESHLGYLRRKSANDSDNSIAFQQSVLHSITELSSAVSGITSSLSNMTPKPPASPRVCYDLAYKGTCEKGTFCKFAHDPSTVESFKARYPPKSPDHINDTKGPKHKSLTQQERKQIRWNPNEIHVYQHGLPPKNPLILPISSETALADVKLFFKKKTDIRRRDMTFYLEHKVQPDLTRDIEIENEEYGLMNVHTSDLNYDGSRPKFFMKLQDIRQRHDIFYEDHSAKELDLTSLTRKRLKATKAIDKSVQEKSSKKSSTDPINASSKSNHGFSQEPLYRFTTSYPT